jgi:thioredoxin reductase
LLANLYAAHCRRHGGNPGAGVRDGALEESRVGANHEEGQPDGDRDGDRGDPADGHGYRRTHSARFIILATGVEDLEPELPNLKNAVHSGLLRHCPICDGFEQRGKRVGVIGWDAAAASEAAFIHHFAPDTTLLSLGRPLVDPPQGLARLGVKVEEAPVECIELVCEEEDGAQMGHAKPRRNDPPAGNDGSPRGERPNAGGKDAHAPSTDDASKACEPRGKLKAMRLHMKGGGTLEFDTMYSALGIRPRTGLARELGLGGYCDDGRVVCTGTHNETNVDGVYAIGDVTDALNQLATAYAGAAMASTHIHQRLLQATAAWSELPATTEQKGDEECAQQQPKKADPPRRQEAECDGKHGQACT